MTKKYLVFDVQEDAQEFVDSTDDNMGYPNEDTENYTAIRNTVQGKFAVLTCPLCYGLMTPEQLESLISVKDAISFWPKIESDI